MRWAIIATVLLSHLPTRALAVPTASFEIASYAEFDKGKPRGTLVSSEGQVVAGYGHRRLEGVEAVMVWSRAQTADGTTYFGTGEKGKLLAVRGDSVRVVADLKTVLITALAEGPGGKLLAGTMPGARVLEVDPKTGKWRQLAKLPAAHVWALLYDRRRRRIFAASGAPGKLFSIPQNGGKPQVYYDAGEHHLLCLAADRRGALLTGGTDRAIIYRVTSKGRARALHDFDATEVRQLAVANDGTIYAGVNKFPRRTAGLPRFDAPRKGEGGTPLSPGKKKKKGKRARYRPNELRPGAKAGKGALYRITPDGRLEQLTVINRGYFTDLALDDKGALWASDGTDGKVLIARGRTVMTAFDMAERQVLALAVGGTNRYLATGDGGAIYRVLSHPSARPRYTTDVLDAKFAAHWGKARVRTTAKLRWESRSGNTAKPDRTWAPWKAARDRGGGRIELRSEPGRYLQLRAVWPASGRGELRSLAVYYRPKNQPPRITEVEIKRTKRKPGKTPAIELKWKVENPDKDELVYRLYYREELGVAWRRMRPKKKPLTKPKYTWNTESIADDTYRIKVEASDERANAPEHTLRHARVSAPVIVDNRPPDVTGLAVRYPYATAMAKDSYSRITSVEYAIDGGPWRLIAVVDGIYDSPVEAFRINLPPRLTTGSHTLAIRVKDAADNIGVRQVRFTR